MSCECGKEIIEDQYCVSCWNNKYCICEGGLLDNDDICEQCSDRIWQEKHKNYVTCLHDDCSYFTGAWRDEIFFFKNPQEETFEVPDFFESDKVFVKFTPEKNFYFQVLFALQMYNKTWKDLNKITKITISTENWASPHLHVGKLDLEFSDTEFSHADVKETPLQFYQKNYFLYEMSLDQKDFEEICKDTFWNVNYKSRWWAGIKVEGYHSNFCVCSETKDFKSFKFSGEEG